MPLPMKIQQNLTQGDPPFHNLTQRLANELLATSDGNSNNLGATHNSLNSTQKTNVDSKLIKINKTKKKLESARRSRIAYLQDSAQPE